MKNLLRFGFGFVGMKNLLRGDNFHFGFVF